MSRKHPTEILSLDITGIHKHFKSVQFLVLYWNHLAEQEIGSVHPRNPTGHLRTQAIAKVYDFIVFVFSIVRLMEYILLEEKS